jgi:hypothetical protein
MAIYTVHEPPPRDDNDADNADRFVFVRDGFAFWAFLLAPLWMLWRRLWLVLLFYVVVIAALQAGLWWLGVSAAVKFTVGLLVALLIGFEAASLRRWTLGRRRWINHGVVVAEDAEAAERRFFDAWMRRDASSASSEPGPVSALPPYAMGSKSPDIIGLFPEPQSRP